MAAAVVSHEGAGGRVTVVALIVIALVVIAQVLCQNRRADGDVLRERMTHADFCRALNIGNDAAMDAGLWCRCIAGGSWSCPIPKLPRCCVPCWRNCARSCRSSTQTRGHM